MRKYLVLLLLGLFAISANAQVSTLTAFSGKAFAKATSRTDTSSTLSIGGYPYVAIQTTSTGTDSAAMTSYLDAYINGLWVNSITSSALTLGRPAGHILEATKGQVNYLMVRTPATTTIDALGGASNFRIRNVITSGAGDSASATTYTQKVILRKP